MKFIYEKGPNTALSFHDVTEDQFFIDCDGYLCQKASEDAYCIIATPEGIPHSCYYVLQNETNEYSKECERERTVRHILPIVTRIEV